MWIVAVLLFLGPGILSAEEMTLDKILSQMDKAGADLSSMRAGIHQKKWTEILEEFDDGESGEFSFLRTPKGAYLRKDIESPTVNSLVIKEGQVLFYQPAIKQAQRYDLGGHGDKAEFLLLGFGSDKEALRETYDITLVGPEQLEEQQTYKLELTPKSEKVAAFFVRISLWVDTEMWVPVQQQLVEPTQDYLLIRFADIELNPKLPKAAFDVDLPKDTRIIGH